MSPFGALLVAALAAPSWEITPEVPRLEYTGFFFTRATHTNVVSTAGFLNNQVSGRFATRDNGSTTRGEGDTMIEQRALAFLDYRPVLLDGRGVLRTAFEVDFAWGDASNTAVNNAGGAINGDTVNLQTKRLQADFDLGAGLTLVAGLQTLADSARKPTEATPDQLMYGGTKLAFWGTDAAGLSLFGKWHRRLHARASYFLLYENATDQNDDVHLTMLDADLPVAPQVQVGLHLWWLKDASRGQGSALGAGPGAPLAAYNGGTRFRLGPDTAEGNLVWAGVDASYNLGLQGGPFTANGFLVLNKGAFEIKPFEGRRPEGNVYDDTPVDLFALMADVMVAYRWGVTNGDVVSFEGIYATGDDTPTDRTVSSVVTGNAYGIPGALQVSHRSLLLMPDVKAVNRQVAAVYDPGNLGYGVMAGFVNASADLVRNRLNLKVGTAAAQSAARPVDGGRQIGVEVNGELVWHAMPFVWLGGHAAWMRLGSFYARDRVNLDDPPRDDPWTVFATLTWVPK
ncbi:MAG: hypothetical protein ACOYM9_13250 [Bradymonadia bacterium]|jgi:hypothetical protein